MTDEVTVTVVRCPSEPGLIGKTGRLAGRSGTMLLIDLDEGRSSRFPSGQALVHPWEITRSDIGASG